MIARLFLMMLALGTGVTMRAQEASASAAEIDYQLAQGHEVKPHRREIPIEGVPEGFNQLQLKVTVDAAGNVVGAEAGGEEKLLKFWPELNGEVMGWRFTPFEKDGKAVRAEVEEYLDLVPPERLPVKHVAAPVLRKDSNITISLMRTGCGGTCPAYTVTIGMGGVGFNGRGNVVADGEHKAAIGREHVRELARKFIEADFYSMDGKYEASVTDSPSQTLTIDIDGRAKKVVDYVGSWVGMPQVIRELEDQVDEVAESSRWVGGSDGLVDALKEEKFNFKTYAAQTMLKAASLKGQAETVSDLLEAGVPLKPIPQPKVKGEDEWISFKRVGWLAAASQHTKTLETIINAGASEHDQTDKDLALARAASAGQLDAMRMLIAYGADPNADMAKLTVTEGIGMNMEGPGKGSVLIYAAGSGDPEVVREILRFHPKLEVKDREGKTAIFAAGESRYKDADGARVECVRVLAEAGANINARDNDGNTPLHETFLGDVEEELLRLGANVNARNHDGETPIFTTVDDQAIALFLKHGADLSIQNRKGETVVEAAKEKGPARQKALREAIEAMQVEHK